MVRAVQEAVFMSQLFVPQLLFGHRGNVDDIRKGTYVLGLDSSLLEPLLVKW